MPPHVDGRPTNYKPLSLSDKTFLLLTCPYHLHVECLLTVTHVARPACRFSVIAHVIDFSWAQQYASYMVIRVLFLRFMVFNYMLYR